MKHSPFSHGPLFLIMIAPIILMCCGPSKFEQEIERLSSGDPKERAYAAFNLGKMKAEKAIPHLIKMLGDDSALKWIRPRFAAIEPGTSTSPGLEAAKALAKIGKLAVEPLTKALEDNNRSVGRSAAVALEKMGEPAAPGLIAALKSEDEVIRRAGINGLIKIQEPVIVDPLITCLNDKEIEIRRKAVEALGKTGDKRAVQPLVQVLLNERSGVQKEAGWALKQIGDPGAEDALLGALRHKDPRVRCGAIVALGGAYSRDNPGIILPYVRDQHPSVRVEAVKVLGWRLKGANKTSVMKSLLAALEDPNGEVRKNVVAGMQYSDKSDRPEAIGALKKSLNDPERIVRKAAVSSLEHLAVYDQDPQAINTLGVAIENRDPQVRHAALWALIRVKNDERCEPLFISALRDRDDSIRVLAAKALGEMNSKSAVAPLIEALYDPEENVRKNAIHALEEINDTQAVEPLVDLLKKKKRNAGKNRIEIIWIKKALKSITGKTVRDADKFEGWWKEEKKKR